MHVLSGLALEITVQISTVLGRLSQMSIFRVVIAFFLHQNPKSYHALTKSYWNFTIPMKQGYDKERVVTIGAQRHRWEVNL